MAATAPDINCARIMTAEPYYERLRELMSIIARQLPYFHRIALRRLDNFADAEDAVQDALLSAFLHIEQFRGRAQMSTWLTRIVINSARMRLRRRQRHMHIPLEGQELEHDKPSFPESLPDCRPDPEAVCRRQELAELLARSSSLLSPTLRRTFLLRDVKGLSIRETARLLGVPVGTVKAQLARARKKLREMMQIHLTTNQSAL